MIRALCIASGSSGNCTYIEAGGAKILVDAGISAKRIVEALMAIDVDPAELDAVFLTHEHTDHIAGLPVFLRKLRIPVYGTYETLQAVMTADRRGSLPPELFRSIQPGVITTVRDAVVSACSISHDAAKPVSYSIVSGRNKIAIATDLGCYDDTIVRHLSDADAVIIESNYDRDMLLVGPYPYALKRRIMGAYGHLSNDDCGSLMISLLHPKLKYVILGHLSKDNNFPALAFESAKATLLKNWHYTEPIPKLLVAPRDNPSELISIG
ncbi:MAG: MBL fold metallo-hydrolase [Lachnospiraceae bacterium]|nr:MBL fold metallo-hydrolase [Lachnospiraceae bacterium]